MEAAAASCGLGRGRVGVGENGEEKMERFHFPSNRGHTSRGWWLEVGERATMRAPLSGGGGGYTSAAGVGRLGHVWGVGPRTPRELGRGAGGHVGRTAGRSRPQRRAGSVAGSAEGGAARWARPKGKGGG
jgi:hypothetical protein